MSKEFPDPPKKQHSLQICYLASPQSNYSTAEWLLCNSMRSKHEVISFNKTPLVLIVHPQPACA